MFSLTRHPCFPPFPPSGTSAFSLRIGTDGRQSQGRGEEAGHTCLTTALVKAADVEDAAAAKPVDHWVPAETFAPAPHVALVSMIMRVARFGKGKHTFPLTDAEVIKAVTIAIKADPIKGDRGASGQGVFYYRLDAGDVVKYSVSQQEERGAPYLSVIQ